MNKEMLNDLEINLKKVQHSKSVDSDMKLKQKPEIRKNNAYFWNKKKNYNYNNNSNYNFSNNRYEHNSNKN